MNKPLSRLMPTVPLSFEPEKWNGEDIVQKFNCYSYALNTRDYGWLPLGGKLSTDREIVRVPLTDAFRAATPEWLRAALWLAVDGLERIHKHEYSPLDTHIIAYDTYMAHFYRLDAGGIWSHKQGGSPITQRDDNGDILLDLDNAAFDLRNNAYYSSFDDRILYFKVPEQGIRMMPADNEREYSGLTPLAGWPEMKEPVYWSWCEEHIGLQPRFKDDPTDEDWETPEGLEYIENDSIWWEKRERLMAMQSIMHPAVQRKLKFGQ